MWELNKHLDSLNRNISLDVWCPIFISARIATFVQIDYMLSRYLCLLVYFGKMNVIFYNNYHILIGSRDYCNEFFEYLLNPIALVCFSEYIHRVLIHNILFPSTVEFPY